MKLENYLTQMKTFDHQAAGAARERLNSIAKPLFSLGALEDAMCKLAGIYGDPKFVTDKKCVVVMCADNGVVAQGVSQAGSEITPIMTVGFVDGDATVCKLSKKAGADVIPVDIGIAVDMNTPGILNRKVAYGTKDFTVQPAMTKAEAELAVLHGIEVVRDLSQKGYNIIATGEMGIGNTTTSAACASVLLDLDPEITTGRGAGMSEEGLAHKIAVIKKGIALNNPDPNDPLDVLSKVGGFDIAGLTGVFLGGAIYGVPILVDGVISAVAALVAAKICPEVKDFMLATHLTAEPAGEKIMEFLNLNPIIRAGMCLGEGTGAVMGFALYDMMVEVYNEMPTFGDLSIKSYKPF